MGDRGNVYIKNADNGVYLYTHWEGSDLPYTVQIVLARQLRWGDEAYLARMIFCEMVGDDTGAETGYGIATYRPDNEHSIVVVDCKNQRVGFADEGEEPKCYVSWPFKKYVGLSTDILRTQYDKEAG